MLSQRLDLSIRRARSKALLFFIQLTSAPLDTLQHLLYMLYAGLLHLSLLSRLCGMLVKLIPLMLPIVHGFFCLHQGFGRGLFHGLQHFQFWRQGFNLHFPTGLLVAIDPQVLFGLSQVCRGLGQIFV